MGRRNGSICPVWFSMCAPSAQRHDDRCFRDLRRKPPHSLIPRHDGGLVNVHPAQRVSRQHVRPRIVEHQVRGGKLCSGSGQRGRDLVEVNRPSDARSELYGNVNCWLGLVIPGEHSGIVDILEVEGRRYDDTLTLDYTSDLWGMKLTKMNRSMSLSLSLSRSMPLPWCASRSMYKTRCTAPLEALRSL